MREEQKRIYVDGIVLIGNNMVRYSVRYGEDVRAFFSREPFFVEYDRDIRKVPPSILMIPLLANLCPVAWLAGAEVHVEQLDKGFYESLLRVQHSLNELYPRLKFSGSLHVRKLTDYDLPEEPARSACFFSGGVDSLATFIDRKLDNPYFITVWGADITLDQPEMWQEVKRYNEEFGHANGIDSLFIKSNLRTFLNDGHIAFMSGRITHGWWPGVQHGMGLVGLTAPLAFILGIKKLYVPSALPPKLAASYPDGSNTRINNQLRWSGTTVQLDGEEKSRQDKVAMIAEYLRHSERDMRIRVCWMNKEYGNCCRCEKCLRTIAALLAEGIDPGQNGFPIDQSTYSLLRQQLPVWLSTGPLKVEYWEEIRLRSMLNNRLIPLDGRAFFDWFQQLDMKTFMKKRSMRNALLDLIPHPLFLYLKRKYTITQAE